MIDLKKLCIEIATTEDGDDVKAILENYSLWNDKSCWKAVGSKGDDDKNLNNFSIIGSQQSNPVNMSCSIKCFLYGSITAVVE